jgi:hypothetical protein
MKPPVITNRKPADELAWVREQIRDLQAREDYIKRMILAGTFDAEGDEVDIVIERKAQKRLDRELLEAEIGDLSDFMKPVEFTMCKVKRKTPA